MSKDLIISPIDHHEPIIQREIWEIAQDMLEMLPGRHRKKRKKAQRLVPVTKGLLKGFMRFTVARG